MSIEALTLVVTLAVLGLSTWLTGRFCRRGSFFYLLDHPNDRSLHSVPTPRTGGVAIMVAMLVGGTASYVFTEDAVKGFGWLLVGLAIVAFVSYVDDRKHLAPGVRIVAHIIAAVLVSQGGFVIDSVLFPDSFGEWAKIVAAMGSVLYIVWMINLYNFMDGMDGFAGGMAVIGFGAFSVLGWQADAALFTALNLVIAAACAGFLLYNFPPARIFMGDTGSSTLGLLAAAFSLWGAQDGIFPLWVALLVFSPFIVDASVTLVRRLLRRERVWQAHRKHYYQRLVQLGWSHRRTVLWEYTVMVACVLSALLSLHARQSVQWTIILFWTVAYAAMAGMVSLIEKRGAATH